MGAMGIREPQGFLRQGHGGLVIQIISVTDRAVSGQGGGPAFRYMFPRFPEAEDLLYRFRIPQPPVRRQGLNTPPRAVLLNTDSQPA